MRRPLNQDGDECYRTGCKRTANSGPHVHIGSFYCRVCAKRINRANGQILVPVTPRSAL